MFDPSNPDTITSLRDTDLLSLPDSEDDRYEYKSSLTRDSELKDKVAKAASAFWNSGGGLFVIGVTGQGKPDGGVSLAVGRQARRDWIDQAIAAVTPRGRYVVHGVEAESAGLDIKPGNGVFLVAFAESEFGLHMAPDNRYYLRAGAHTALAGHFLVEAIHARRGLRTPLLRHVVRAKAGVLAVEVVAVTEVPALDVEIQAHPEPPDSNSWRTGFPLRVPVISRQHPYSFDVHYQIATNAPLPIFDLVVRFRDVAGRQCEQTMKVDLNSDPSASLGGQKGPNEIEARLNEIARAVESVARGLEKLR